MVTLLLGGPHESMATEIRGLARVNDRGHLFVAGREVALAGIDLPTYDRTCRQSLGPPRCGPRAVLILDNKVTGFVHCAILGERPDDVLEGRCTVANRRLFDDRIDLAAEMLREGWAFARDDAPGHYRALERLARSREIGIWRDAAVELR